MSQIRVSPEQLRNAATQLDSHRQEIDGVLNSTINIVHGLQGEWLGMAQIDYTRIFDNEVPTMRVRVGEIIESLASELRRIAMAFEETDQRVV
ncbi:MAG: WXG100 family type VII secretion target [Anaerolineae bacterium]|nr:WXG100 family type VII secretion target [Anaerolineae bacterium]